MKKYFQNTKAEWAKYSRYEIREDPKGTRYVLPAKGAELLLLDPLEHAEDFIVDALNTARLVMHDRGEDPQIILDFLEKYGLLGLMTGIPLTAHFMDYENVYFPYNEYLKTECMDVLEYINLFFPFHKPTLRKCGRETVYEEGEDNEQKALMMVFSHEAVAKYLVMRRDYAEPYDWIVKQILSWAAVFFTGFFYYEDLEDMDEMDADMLRKSMRAFSQVSPTYHIELVDRPIIVWEFHSLMSVVQTMIAFVLADEDTELSICRECGKIYISGREDNGYCEECKQN